MATRKSGKAVMNDRTDSVIAARPTAGRSSLIRSEPCSEKNAALKLLEQQHWHDRFASEVTDRYSLLQANEALTKARLGNGGKTVITP